MKAKLLSMMMALVAMLAGLVACGSDNDDEIVAAGSYVPKDAVVVGVPGRGNGFNTTCKVALRFDYVAQTTSVTFSGITFTAAMPAIDFDLAGMKTSFLTRKKGSFSGSGLTPMDGYVVNNVTGAFDADLDLVTMSFDVVSSRATTHITITGGHVMSAITDGDDYEATAERFYNFDLSDIAQGGGDLYIHNVQFVSAMPKQKRLRIPLADATIVNTDKGYNITGTAIVPYFLSGSTEVPMAEREVDNLVATIDVATGTFAVEFDCFGLHFTDSGQIYPSAASL